MTENVARLRGIRMSLLDAGHEVTVRSRLPEGTTLFTGDDHHLTATDYRADVEVEIVNQAVWDADPAEVARRTAARFAAYVGPWVAPS
jgi:hypothetical protein